ncbi:alpha,alpha-trehalase ath1 [Mortierella hygrophila]|uniref:alpha,alpha-trehalase n=1 Tax=Mortierella hygrophila TaxID=979708 RepID=A0A9P6EVT3_9FUNG|nr:alpha,alpha-trehalase ath1 [Mortierella hygrophila]
MRSNPMRLVVSLTAVIVAVTPVFTSGSPIATSATPSPSSSDEWIFRTTSINTTSFQAEPYVSNGYIGARLPAEGMGLRIHPAIDYDDMNGTQGWPLFSLRQTASIVAGFYGLQNETRGTNFEQTGGEQVISLLPTWTSLYLTVSSAPGSGTNDSATYRVDVDLEQIKSFSQSLSMRDGIVETTVVWSPFDSTSSSASSDILLHYTVLAHRSRPSLGLVRLDVSGLAGGQQVVFTDAIDGAGAQRVEGEQAGKLKETELPYAIYSAVRPSGITNVTAWEISTLSIFSSDKKAPKASAVDTPDSVGLNTNDKSSATIAQSYSVTVPSNGKISVFKAVGIASSDAFEGIERDTALKTAKQARNDGWESLVKEHTAAWETLWADGGEVIIHGAEKRSSNSTSESTSLLTEIQTTTRSSLFHLLANVRSGLEGKGLGDNSIAPAGLTSDSYAGGIFWDADTWMYPSLLSLFPDYAMSINNYRTKNLGAAMENAKQFNRSGLLYPWVAFRYGNCTGIGPCYDYEYHLNNDIALAQWQYFLSTNNKTWLADYGYPIMKAVSDFWGSQVIRQPGTPGFTTKNETDPDEYANFKDNAAFTNAGASVTLRNSIEAAKILGISSLTPSNWSDIADNIAILYDNSSNIVLEYDGFNAATPVKQADVVLLIYPLEYPVPNPKGDLAFYAGANSPNGPGMTYSIFSIDSAQLSYQGCEAFTYLLQSSEPYVREPFHQFSEQTSDIYADNGHTNPAYTFLTGNGGYLQIWTHGFTGYRPRLDCFYLDPTLPPQLAPKGFTVKGMKWQGSVFDVTVAGDKTTVTRRAGGKGKKACVRIGERNRKSGKYQLAVGQTLTVGTYRSDLNGTLVPGNKAQCPPSVISKDPILPGQYALAAVDGSNATYWRPSTRAPASMTIDLGRTQSIKGFHFNFNHIPPVNYTVLVGNSAEDAELKEVVKVDKVEITAPYDTKDANVVKIRLGNTSDVSLAERVRARFVKLVVEGVLTDDGTSAGATVAEVVVY